MNDRKAWRAISRAPRDGTRILAYREGYAESVAVVFWNDYSEDWQPVNGDVFPGVTRWRVLPDPPRED